MPPALAALLATAWAMLKAMVASQTFWASQNRSIFSGPGPDPCADMNLEILLT